MMPKKARVFIHVYLWGTHLNHLTMMKRASMLTAFLLLVSLSCVLAQSLSPTVISPAGRFASVGGYTLSETVGEMTMVETYSAGGSILTQGFQQPSDNNVRVPIVQQAGYDLTVSPNPGTGSFYFNVAASAPVTIDIRVTDVIGQTVGIFQTSGIEGAQRLPVDLSGLRQGVYFAEVWMNYSTGTTVYRMTHRLQVVR